MLPGFYCHGRCGSFCSELHLPSYPGDQALVRVGGRNDERWVKPFSKA